MRRATSGSVPRCAWHNLFLSTLSLRRATVLGRKRIRTPKYFYPRSPCGERLSLMFYDTSSLIFLSTLSLRRATACVPACFVGAPISIHALLAESDVGTICQLQRRIDFYPRSPCGERRYLINTYHRIFGISIHALLAESDRSIRVMYPDDSISIHALLAESDCITTITICTVSKFLSTLSLRRATVTVLGIQHKVGISIHALLAESDASSHALSFYPRSPCGERHSARPDTRQHDAISIHALLAESDSKNPMISVNEIPFLSTLSLRRATDALGRAGFQGVISIHALLAESDALWSFVALKGQEFLSTLSLRRATIPDREPAAGYLISIHALLAESDHYDNYNLHCVEISIHALLAESDACAIIVNVLV